MHICHFPQSLYPHRVRKDLEKATECARKFDAEAGIVDNPLLKESLLAQLSPIRRLNLMLLYLRKIHFLCYYCGKHFLSEEHLFARCSGMHERKVPADPSLAMSGNIDIDEHTESGQIIKKDQTVCPFHMCLSYIFFDGILAFFGFETVNMFSFLICLQTELGERTGSTDPRRGTLCDGPQAQLGRAETS